MGGTIEAFIHSVRSVLGPLIDFIFPPACVACSRLLINAERHVCRPCWDSIPRLTGDHPLFLDTKQKLLDTGVITDLVSVFLFEKDGVFQKLAHALKYDGFGSVGILLGREIGNAMLRRGVRADLLVPVPLHKAKLRERGFNQAERIACGISQATNIPLRADLIQRRRVTKTQTKLSLLERRLNVDGAFSPATGEKVIDGIICVLVDDVITTGATISSCAKELIEAGASGIIAVSAALAE